MGSLTAGASLLVPRCGADYGEAYAMNVRVQIQFESPGEDDWDAMKSLAQSVTNDRRGVRVFALDDAPNWLVVEFTMPTEAQYLAVDKIDRAVRLHAWERLDSTIGFPKSVTERARAQRKAERRRAKRRAPDADEGNGRLARR